MDGEELLIKVYTIAFRLTGEEEAAINLALTGLTLAARHFSWQPLQPAPPGMPLSSFKEVCRLFLTEPWRAKRPRSLPQALNDHEQEAILQAALLTLKPLERVTVIWWDVMGLQLVDMAQLAGNTEEELSIVLGHARQELTRLMKLAG